MRDKETLKDIDRYLKGEMSAGEADQLWAKLLEHPEYLRLLETELHARNYFENKPLHSREGINSKSNTKYTNAILTYKNWIYAVAALLAVILMYQLFSLDRQSEFHSELLATISPQEMVTMDIYRAAGEESESLDLAINRGFEAAVSGRVEESFAHFLMVLDDQPLPFQEAVASLNLGILHYNNSDFTLASEAFENATSKEGLADYLYEKGLWFLGHSLAREGKYQEALIAFTEVYEFNAYFSEEAERLVKKFERLIGDS
jgi:tetratricopeptide (TPR) repeat protein